MATEVVAQATRPRRGWKWVLGVSFLALVGIASLLLHRATTLRGLPDIGDPFDVARYARVEIPADQNAFTFYVRAHEQYKPNEPQGMWSTFTNWSEVNESVRKYLETNRPALEIWFEGTKRHRALYKQPGTLDFETMLPAVQTLRGLTRLANLEACRLEHQGDLASSWAWLRANLRASRHTGINGVVIERLVGIAIYAVTSQQARHWADNPKVDARMLRQALDDVLALDALTPSLAVTIRAEYYAIINSIDDSELRDRIFHYQDRQGAASFARDLKERTEAALGILIHEPERSRRVVRLVIANWLSAADLPTIERAKRLTQAGKLTVYSPTPGQDPPMSLEEIGRWYESTLYAKSALSSWSNVDRAVSRDEQTRAALIVHLAEQLYLRERGMLPDRPEQLVGAYLKELPASYKLTEESQASGPSR